MHAVNTVFAALVWLAVLSIVYTELHKEKVEMSRNSYLTIEQALTGTLSAAVFMLFRISHGYASVRAMANQIQNPLLLRSSVSQIICLVYAITSLLLLYFVLLDSVDESPVGQAQFALQWLVLFISASNVVFVLEQFSHPQLIYCCDNDTSRQKLKMRFKGAKKGQEHGEGVALKAMDDNEVTEIEDCSDDGGASEIEI